MRISSISPKPRVKADKIADDDGSKEDEDENPWFYTDPVPQWNSITK
jgi:hypothetical protein